jgi:hypothetical protein
MYCGIWRHGDFNNWYQNGFLYSSIKETVYLQRPLGWSPNIVPSLVKFNICLYSLRHAAHEWRQLLDSSLKRFGFVQLKIDACVYKLTVIDQNINGTLTLGVFVDDIFCLGTRKFIIQWFWSLLPERFLSPLSLMLNHFWVCMTSNRSTKCIWLSQPGYISNIMFSGQYLILLIQCHLLTYKILILSP